jgi:hypothetical protein
MKLWDESQLKDNCIGDWNDKDKVFQGTETVYEYGGDIWDDTRPPTYTGDYNGDSLADGSQLFQVQSRDNGPAPVHPVAVQVLNDFHKRVDKQGLTGHVRYQIKDAGFLHGPLGVKRISDNKGEVRTAYSLFPGLHLRWQHRVMSWRPDPETIWLQPGVKGHIHTFRTKEQFCNLEEDDPILQWRNTCLESTTACVLTAEGSKHLIGMVLVYDLGGPAVYHERPWGMDSGAANAGDLWEYYSTRHNILVSLVDLSGLNWGRITDGQVKNGMNKTRKMLFPIKGFTPHGMPHASTLVGCRMEDRRVTDFTRDSFYAAPMFPEDPFYVEDLQRYQSHVELEKRFSSVSPEAQSIFSQRGSISVYKREYKERASHDASRSPDGPRYEKGEHYIPDRKLPANISAAVRKFHKATRSYGVTRLSRGGTWKKEPDNFESYGPDHTTSKTISLNMRRDNTVPRDAMAQGAPEYWGWDLDVSFKSRTHVEGVISKRILSTADAISEVFTKQGSLASFYDAQRTYGWGWAGPGELRAKFGDLLFRVCSGDFRMSDPDKAALKKPLGLYKDFWAERDRCERFFNNIQLLLVEDRSNGLVWSTHSQEQREYVFERFNSWAAWEHCYSSPSSINRQSTLRSLLATYEGRNTEDVYEAVGETQYRVSGGTSAAEIEKMGNLPSPWTRVANATPYVAGLGWAFVLQNNKYEQLFGRHQGFAVYLLERGPECSSQ